MLTGFSSVWALTVDVESDRLSTDRNDPGNWTGGKVGGGKFVGSKFGISAAAFPDIDIPNLTAGEASALAKKHYWDAYSCDQFSPAVGYLVFDAAYNGGHPVQWLQQAVGVAVDGVVGAQTIAAVRAMSSAKLALLFMAARLEYWTQCEAWPAEGRGWINRGAGVMRTISGSL